MDHDGEGNEALLLPRADLLLELANDGDARRRELGRGQRGANREREEAGEGAGEGEGERQGGRGTRPSLSTREQATSGGRGGMGGHGRGMAPGRHGAKVRRMPFFRKKTPGYFSLL